MVSSPMFFAGTTGTVTWFVALRLSCASTRNCPSTVGSCKRTAAFFQVTDSQRTIRAIRESFTTLKVKEQHDNKILTYRKCENIIKLRDGLFLVLFQKMLPLIVKMALASLCDWLVIHRASEIHPLPAICQHFVDVCIRHRVLRMAMSVI